MPLMDGRVALVTGASRGIGRAVARRYAEEGAHVIALARSQAGLEELDDEVRAAGLPGLTLIVEDLTKLDAIDRIAVAIYERFKKLDVLVANAGLIGELAPMHQIDPAEWEKVLTVNLTANFRLLRGFDPLLRASEAGRAIYVSSGAAQGIRPYWGPYAVSKAGLEMMVRSYAAEVEKVTNIRANLLDPGATRTKMRQIAYPGEHPDTLKPPEALADLFVEMSRPAFTKSGELVTYTPPAG
ncbi:SDR family NAD(P)-dependent oxidoreductase [Roseospirillum parvum]|uniref:NAD(P)-dependent dehydrogenase, short-chain alcohol dehydrogenase family n=1 Tax=Roseospirillum parvum TaxID=83401 RepID=A0A1G8AYM9_9PROT|nr:SDR family NAD(P)-dependent oxidoreductase [Roseospirillum parvum]SDH26132.1 NAD(P)-dependent dehydrogenase, short-chain alcohol dehydrogenase family [Roseospirillum parvum]